MSNPVRRRPHALLLAFMLALIIVAVNGFSASAGAASLKHAATTVTCTPTTDASGKPTLNLIPIDATCVPDAGAVPTTVLGRAVHRVFLFDPTCHPFASTPANRNLMTDSQLLADSLLPRTAFPSLAQWQDVMNHSQVRVCTSWTDEFSDGTPVNVNGSTFHAPATMPAQTAQPANAGNVIGYDAQWNGYVSLDTSPGWDHSAAAGYSTVPCLTESEWSYHAAAFWVGNSSYYGNSLLQDGVDVKTYAGVWILNQLFYENTGNTQYGEIDWHNENCNHSFYAYATGDYVYMTDYEDGRVLSTHLGPVAAADSAECIAERVGSDPGVYPLSHFQQQNFTYCEWEDQNGVWGNLDRFGDSYVAEQVLTSNGVISGHQLMNFPWYYPTGGGYVGDSYWNQFLYES